MSSPIYRMRPSKQVARHMFVEALLRMTPIAKPTAFQYVGFGALEFIDFDLLHRRLGISRMFSIESDLYSIDRYRQNRPYNGIEILPGRATDQLGLIDWQHLSIVWLDYTKRLNDEAIGDVEYLCRELLGGSVLAVTFNADPGKLTLRRKRLASAVTEARVPSHVTTATLGDWGLAATQHAIFSSLVNSTLSSRGDAASWHQFLNINYQDGARIQFIAGIIGLPGMQNTIEACHLDEPFYTRDGTDPFTIRVPYFTAKERRALNEQLPRGRGRRLGLIGVDKSDIDAYAEVYRWLVPSA
jgi:hypothetical protein